MHVRSKLAESLKAELNTGRATLEEYRKDFAPAACRWRFSREPVSRGHRANPRAVGSRGRVSQGAADHEKRVEGRQRGD